MTSTGQVFFTTDVSPDVSEGKSFRFEVVGTGEFVDDQFDLASEPAWMGTITGLRLDPVEGIAVDVDVDRIWFPVADA